MARISLQRLGAAFGIALLLMANATATADMIDIGGGWSVETPDGFDGDIFTDAVTDDFVIIEVSKDFHLPRGEDGMYPPIELRFSQIADDANTSPRIIINDEIITNMTGSTWTDFHWEVDSEGLDAWFNTDPNSTVNSLGFMTTPFVNRKFSSFIDSPDNLMATALHVDGGMVANLNSFAPGSSGAGGGDLVIDVDLNEDDINFIFRQYPTPEPPLLFAMLAIVPLVIGRMRRG